MRLGEVYQLILRQAQHEVWKRRSPGESADSISDDLGENVETVHAWFLERGARQDAAVQLSRPTGALILTFSAASCQIDGSHLKGPEQPSPTGPPGRSGG
jgi:hypothetical protein